MAKHGGWLYIVKHAGYIPTNYETYMKIPFLPCAYSRYIAPVPLGHYAGGGGGGGGGGGKGPPTMTLCCCLLSKREGKFP